MIDPVTGLPSTYYPSWKRRGWYVFSFLAMLPLLLVGVAVMTLSLNLNGYVKDPHSPIFVAQLATFSKPVTYYVYCISSLKWLDHMVLTRQKFSLFTLQSNIYTSFYNRCLENNHETSRRARTLVQPSTCDFQIECVCKFYHHRHICLMLVNMAERA